MTAGHPSDASLLALLARDLPAAETAEAEAHLASCVRCQEAVGALDEVMGVARVVHAVPQDLARRRGRLKLEARLREDALKSRRGLRGSRLLVVAGVAGLSGAALAMTASRVLSPPPTPAEAAWQPDAVKASLPEEPSRAGPSRAGPDASPVAASPVAASPVAASPVAASPVAASPVAASPVAASPVAASPVAASQGADAPSPADTPLSQPAAAEPRAQTPPSQPQPPSARAAPPPRTPANAATAALPPTAIGPSPSADAEATPDEAVRVARASGTPSSAEAYADAVRQLTEAGPAAAGWTDVGELAALAGDPEGAIDAWVTALPRQDGKRAAQRLEQIADSGSRSVEELEARVLASTASAESAEGMRLLCAWGLIHRGDRAAVGVCQTFGRRFPDHPDVRALALSAGRTAEVRVGDLRLAEEEYSRAILVSQYAGLPGTTALFARARVRARLGDLEEAKADLRLFLHVQPEAAFRDDVEALAATLRVELPNPLRQR